MDIIRKVERYIATVMVMENVRLRAQELGIKEFLDAVKAQEDAVKRSTRALDESFATARRMVEFAHQPKSSHCKYGSTIVKSRCAGNACLAGIEFLKATVCEYT